MKFSILFLSFLFTLPLFACPTMDQVDNTQREGIKLDLARDEKSTGVMHQHSESHEPLFNTAAQDNSISQEKKKGLMSR
jgi:hypothetical protein